MRVPFIPYVQGLNDYEDGDGTKYGLAFHNTSNNASDTAEAAYATRRTDGISSHFYGDTDSVTQSIDTDDRCGHAGSREGNENAICFELTGANAWSRARWLTSINWPLLGQVAAAVIRAHWPDGSFQVRRASVAEMKANPKIKACYGHDDMRRAWGGTTHTDPGPGFPWDYLFKVINDALGGFDVATADEVHNLYLAEFYGGRDCGEEVADEYRTRKPDGTFKNEFGNSNVEKIRQLTGEQAKLLAAIKALPPGSGPQSFTINLTGTAEAADQ